jgi:hypothetical protein
MIFIAKNRDEYIATITEVQELNLHDPMIFQEQYINGEPEWYPVIVFLDVRDYDDGLTIINPIKFIYYDSIPTGKEFIEKGYELAELYDKLDILHDITHTSGLINRPLEEMAETQENIDKLEKIIFSPI